MLSWLRKPAVGPLSEPVKAILVHQRGIDEQQAAALRMMHHNGSYSGRKVTYFKVFDPTALKAAGVEPRNFTELDGSGVLYSGHVEAEGQVVLTR